jgi:hypothetical protein
MTMTTKKWEISSAVIIIVLTLIGLGFAAMSTNPPFQVQEWVPYAFFFAVGILAIGLMFWLIWGFLARKAKAQHSGRKIMPLPNRDELLRTIAEAWTAMIKTLEIVAELKEWEKQNPNIMNIEALKLVETAKQRQRNAYESYEKEILVAGSDWEPILKALKINMQISWIFIASMENKNGQTDNSSSIVAYKFQLN